MKRIALALMMVFTLSFATRAYAQDNGTEFFVNDDLTVGGTGGSNADPDVQFDGVVKFAAPGSIHIADAIANEGKTLIANSLGRLEWSAGGGKLTDQLSDTYLPVWESANSRFINSAFNQNDADAPTLVTLKTGVDLTLGAGDDLLLTSGNLTMTGILDVTGTGTISSTLGVGGKTSLGDDLDVAGNTAMTGELVVAGATTLGTDDTTDLLVKGDATLNKTLTVKELLTAEKGAVLNSIAGGAVTVTDDGDLSVAEGKTELTSILAAEVPLTVSGVTDANAVMMEVKSARGTIAMFRNKL